MYFICQVFNIIYQNGVLFDIKFYLIRYVCAWAIFVEWSRVAIEIKYSIVVLFGLNIYSIYRIITVTQCSIGIFYTYVFLNFNKFDKFHYYIEIPIILRIFKPLKCSNSPSNISKFTIKNISMFPRTILLKFHIDS